MMNIKITFGDEAQTGALVALLKSIHAKVIELTREVRGERQAIVKELDDLQAAVTKQQTATASAVTLIQGIAQQLKDAATDPAAIENLAQQLSASADDLANAVTANTPAAPAA